MRNEAGIEALRRGGDDAVLDEFEHEGRSRLRPWAHRVAGALIPVLGAALLIALWKFATDALKIPPYILPKPEDVWDDLLAGLLVRPSDPLGFYLPLWSTLCNAAAGFAIAAGLGLFFGALMAEFRLTERLLMPYFFALQSLPKIAVAPLIVIWFGFGDGSKIALSALLAFFPITVNVFAGCRAVDADKIDLMSSLLASRLQTFIYVKLPSAAPYVFAGINMAIVYAFLGAIVAEFLGAPQGMGVTITKAQAIVDVATVFAALTVLGATGIGLHLAVRWAERRIVHWHRAERD